MILECPNCQTQFKTPATDISASGRKVRCSQCQHVWHCEPSDDVYELTQKKSQRHAYKSNSREESQEVHTQVRAKANKTKRRLSWAMVCVIWGVTLLILGTCITQLYLQRGYIVTLFPTTQGTYAAFGIKATPNGLVLSGVEISQETVDEKLVLFIEGYIENVDTRRRVVPDIAINFQKVDGETVLGWIIKPTRDALEADERFYFTSQYINPPDDMVTIDPVWVEN